MVLFWSEGKIFNIHVDRKIDIKIDRYIFSI
jgi:hypothetical protein